ncbi:hypothetical protein EV368DRAFT_65746 [Lentinula lateritia]|uniref:Uncharacterized protein n=1 Tax=Lentinula aff. lateritia TaxID=2804960 RepID=A0ACC1TWF6_9AGAR|nr:hypothetical protein F5876DRAFT_66887 [Lentinula aff. lateritia]KAJ3851434.1 hypothetical protein EV368DRAFT_65746 [Lentinula lateritia]
MRVTELRMEDQRGAQPAAGNQSGNKGARSIFGGCDRNSGGYKEGVEECCNERDRIEPALHESFDTLTGGDGQLSREIDEKVFRVEDPHLVLGSLLKRMPGLDGIYSQLSELTENKKLSSSILPLAFS